MKRHVLSKSTFMKGLQCHKALYLDRYYPELRNELTDAKRRLFETGHAVGACAHGLFPGGAEVDVRSFRSMQDAVRHTADLIANGAGIIYEAGFQFDGVLVFTDILVRGEAGWKIYEVKSSTELKPQFIPDTAVQYHVVGNAGLEIEDVCLVHINNQYVREGEIDVDALFSVASVLQPVHEIRDTIGLTIEELKEVLRSREIPRIEIGEYCHNPYECDFTGYCWEHVPSGSVFDLSGLGISRKFELYRSGVMMIEQIPDDYPLNSTQRRQVESHRLKSDLIDREPIRNFLRGIRYPIHFLDFETIAPAIPLYDDTRPYQQIPVQYSLHIKENGEADLKHFEYLGLPDEDPRRRLVEKLVSDMAPDGDILVYNKTFEKTRLKELGELFPEYMDVIESILARMKDLMLVFKNRYYYTPSMRGSYSIKEVLPALVHVLDYSDLEISDGQSAMSAYERLLREKNQAVIGEIRRNLLEYCKRDTLALVRTLEALQKL